MSFIKQAFEKVCDESIEYGEWYVSLVEDIPYYGGPEEGGWWGRDSIVLAFQVYPTEELADQAAAGVLKLAKELEQEARKSYGEQCLRETEWLEARGLDDSFLPEPDGPSEYRVCVTGQIPKNRMGCRHYE